jgi:hypothetical protein
MRRTARAEPWSNICKERPEQSSLFTRGSYSRLVIPSPCYQDGEGEGIHRKWMERAKTRLFETAQNEGVRPQDLKAIVEYSANQSARRLKGTEVAILYDNHEASL